MAEQTFGGEKSGVLGEVLAVHDQVLPIHVDLDVRDPPGPQGVDDVQGHADVAHKDLHRRLRVLVLEEHRDAALGGVGRGVGDTVQEARPRFCVRRLERIVVTLDSWPDDHLRADIAGKVAFLTGPGAISYAESCMGIVEHYQLGEIVGATTAGTNGNVNPVPLPGNYTMVWTGMKVLKHDGSQHHRVGIQPTVPCSKTIQGIREGRDEQLEKAVEVVKKAVGSSSMQ